MLDAQEHQLVLEILNKRRAWLLNQINNPNAEYNEIERYKSMGKVLGSAIEKVQNAGPPVEPKSSGGEDINFAQLRVLIVEDDRSSAELMKTILADLSFEQIETAKDGNEALIKLFQSEEAFDIVLCDWNMPGKNGLEVHTTLKTDSRFKDIIFMLVSAVASGEQIRAAITQGVSDYVVKPIDERVLKRKIITAYNKKNKKL